MLLLKVTVRLLQKNFESKLLEYSMARNTPIVKKYFVVPKWHENELNTEINES